MLEVLVDGHRWLGYLMFVLVIASVVVAMVRARNTARYDEGLPRLVGLVLALQVVYGLVVYGIGGYWDAAPLQAYVHPLLMVGAVGLAGVATARAGRAARPDVAWNTIARFHGIALLLVVLGIGAASMA